MNRGLIVTVTYLFAQNKLDTCRNEKFVTHLVCAVLENPHREGKKGFQFLTCNVQTHTHTHTHMHTDIFSQVHQFCSTINIIPLLWHMSQIWWTVTAKLYTQIPTFFLSRFGAFLSSEMKFLQLLVQTSHHLVTCAHHKNRYNYFEQVEIVLVHSCSWNVFYTFLFSVQ